MSKTSKARRDAKKKKSKAGGRSVSPGAREPQVVAQLLLDNQPFSAIAHDGREWVLVMQDGVAAGASDPGSIWGIIQSIAAKAEANGNFVSLQSANEFRALVGDNKLESIGEDFDEMANKVLTLYALPKPPLELSASSKIESAGSG